MRVDEGTLLLKSGLGYKLSCPSLGIIAQILGIEEKVFNRGFVLLGCTGQAFNYINQ